MTNLKRLLYKRYLQNPGGDLVGGITAGVVALPLCLAFGVASGLGAAAGLYGAIALGIIAAAFGGTPAQCSGPTGPMTVISASIASTYAGRPELLFASCFVAGVMQIAMGYLKVGELIQYMPYPVISGFMTGIGVIIICIQFGPLFGHASSGNVLTALQNLPAVFGAPNYEALTIGALVIAVIYLFPRLTKRIPATLIALLIATWVAQAFHMNVPRIGDVPSALPLPQLPKVDWSDAHIIVQNGLTLAVLGAIDSLLTSVVMDKVTGHRHNSNQELLGQGMGNMLAGLIGGLPGAGATMRSMVAVKSGATTNLAGIVHGLVLLLILLGLGRFAGMIPLSALAGVLLTVGISILDWRVLRTLKKHPRSDILVMGLVLGLTIFVDLIIAVLAGMAFASMIFVKQLADAKVSGFQSVEALEELSRHAGHIPEEVRKLIYTYQFNGPLFFGEAKNLSGSVERLSEAKYIILRFYNVPLIDQTGAFAVEHALAQWQAKGIKVLFVGMQGAIKNTLEQTGVLQKMPEANCFDRYEDAIAAIDLAESAKETSG